MSTAPLGLFVILVKSCLILLKSSDKTSMFLMKQSSRVTFISGNVSATSVSINWSIPEWLQHNISSYLLRYKTLGDKDWFLSERLIYSTMRYTLRCLSPSRWYKVELQAFPVDRIIATQFFNTSSIKGLNTLLILNLQVSAFIREDTACVRSLNKS